MRRSGFATIVALTVLALVAAALSAMAISMHMDQQRTHRARVQAQQRQLLLAAASDVTSRSQQWPRNVAASEWNIAVPEAASTLSLKTKWAGPDTILVVVVATVEGHPLDQTIELHFDDGGWSVRSAALGRK